MIEISRFSDDTDLHKALSDERNKKSVKRKTADAARVVEQVIHRARAGAGVNLDLFEALLGENDLVEINYLERGLMASRTVCRINVPAIVGDSSEWGTGFLIGPRLLLTN